MNPKKILKDAINKHNLSTLKDFKNQEDEQISSKRRTH
jgi:hypothetical protein